MLAGLKVSSLECKCIFYRTKQNSKAKLNFEGLEMQKENIPIDTASRVDEKMGHFSSYHVYSRSYGH